MHLPYFGAGCTHIMFIQFLTWGFLKAEAISEAPQGVMPGPLAVWPDATCSPRRPRLWGSRAEGSLSGPGPGARIKPVRGRALDMN